MTASEFIAVATGLSPKQINGTLTLFEGGATIPFIARYRKEMTGNLDEEQIDHIQKEQNKFDAIEKRKIGIREAIREKGKLTAELETKINTCFDLHKLEDIYLPYKQKRQTKAEIAIKAGLAPLAARLMKQENGDPEYWAQPFVSKTFPDALTALKGALDIIAEWISENEIVREKLRTSFFENGVITSKVVPAKKEEAEKYRDYFELVQTVSKCPSYRLLAMLRGEDEGFLNLKIEPNAEYVLSWLKKFYIKNSNESSVLVEKAMQQAYKKSLQPALETETRNHFKELADDQSIHTFSKNLEKLLLAPPVGNCVVLAMDPGFKSGCKIVVLNKAGSLVHNETIFPHPPQNESSKAASKIAQLVQSYKVEVIAIGDGTAGRETENFIKKIRFDRDLRVFSVREDGASIYSASKVAREEFPDFDVTVRGAVSIGRRLMDPLAELVKIDPKSLGVGQYQHDVNQAKLQAELDKVVERAVNKVGVDVNTASKYLLSYVSGLGPKLAENIILHREKNGLFKSRKELLKVDRMGDKAFQQAAGFLRIKESPNLLDNSAVHPENYGFVERLVKAQGLDLKSVIGNRETVNTLHEKAKNQNEVGEYTLQDILKELEKPGLDPRKAVKVLEFAADVKTLNDLKTGMQLNGIVTNVTDFGAFVNIGIKENGLIHKSRLSGPSNFHPADVIHIHDHVQVLVLSIDSERKRIGLALAER
ncbi:MAG: RNA-binding transcriptional accessory protein [Bacteroidetes bacterium]|nr:RNA-binding transcriptional accessory protein [Bacteroidota bacterium]